MMSTSLSGLSRAAGIKSEMALGLRNRCKSAVSTRKCHEALIVLLYIHRFTKTQIDMWRNAINVLGTFTCRQDALHIATTC